MLNTKRTQMALMKMVEHDPLLKPIVDNLVSTSSANEIEYQNKFEAVMSILRERGMKVDDIDPSDTETVVGVLMGAVFSMQMELTMAKTKELDIQVNINPFDEDDIQIAMARERIQQAFQHRLDGMKSHEPVERFKSENYWKGVKSDFARWIQASLLLKHSEVYDYKPLSAWVKLVDSYGRLG